MPRPAGRFAECVLRVRVTGAMGHMKMTENVMEQAADSDLEVSEGQLVWYNERKGYGFVRIGDEEVFLHRSTLDRFGLVRLLNGDHVTVSLSTNEHGRVIKDLLSVRRAVIPEPPAASEPEEGEVRAADGGLGTCAISRPR